MIQDQVNEAAFAPDPALHGLQVFVVEDEALVAMLIEDMLTDLGCQVVGVAGTVAEAMERAAALPAIDVAILDVNLGGEFVFPVADALKARGVPFVFSTAYVTLKLEARYPGSRLLRKPYLQAALADTLAGLSGPMHS